MIAVYSPNGSLDALFLSNYAIINVIDSLARIHGVGLAQLAASDYSMRVWFFRRPDELQPDVQATSSMPSGRQNVQAAVGRIGAEPIAERPAIPAVPADARGG